ncbi:MAG TPA: hypothetical protein VN715_02595 [Roseiarcus sp.]|nr:hypothetical protein [Roseiarcus sp.]
MTRSLFGSLKFGVRAAAIGLALAASGVSADQGPQPLVSKSFRLPISAARDQGDSDLCWVYATLNMLESNYLARHPQSKIELSRALVQRASIADRFHRAITGNSDHLEDGGVAVDAVSLIRQHGLVAEQDFHPVVDSTPVWDHVADAISEAPGEADKLAALNSALASQLGATPQTTRLDGRELTPTQLAKAVLGDNVWTEYDVARDGKARVGPSQDPDARPGTQAHYVDLPTAVGLIHKSLARNQAVVWSSSENHALVIYGADYDAEGRPLAYWVKDSFAPYNYRAPAEKIEAELTDVTVAIPPREAALN